MYFHFISHNLDGPYYEKIEENVEDLQVLQNGHLNTWNKVCSAEGYPLPILEWYYNENPVSHKSVNKSAYHIVTHRRHSFVSKVLIIDDLVESSSGKYVCMLNNTKVLKSINLIVKNEDANQLKKTITRTSSFKSFVIVMLIITVISITVVGLVLYLKQ